MEQELPKFDPELLPAHLDNKKAAEARDWKYDPKHEMYRDEDGCLMADKFGQPL